MVQIITFDNAARAQNPLLLTKKWPNVDKKTLGTYFSANGHKCLDVHIWKIEGQSHVVNIVCVYL